MSGNLYTTVEVAKAAGVPRATLQHWIKTGKITAPPIRLRRNKAVRLWTEAQKERIRRLRGSFKSGPKQKARGGRRSQSC
jgi:DNA-binding transcriptional MerR regulator